MQESEAMAGIFEDIQFQKTDLNTVKELKEDCWRKAQGEDLEAFLGFYLKKNPHAAGRLQPGRHCLYF